MTAKDQMLDKQIIQIIQAGGIAEQSQLQEALKRLGYDIPQATLSRRLKKLKIAKVEGIYKAIDFNMVFVPPVLNLQVAEPNLIVLHTYPGNGNSLAYFIDQKYISFYSHKNENHDILGTIAGDDTVLVIVKDLSALKKTVLMLEEEMG